MTDHDDGLVDSLPLESQVEIDRLCHQFEQARRNGQSPRIEEFAGRVPDQAHRVALRELIAQEVDLRWASGRVAERAEYEQRFPTQCEAVNQAFALLAARIHPADPAPDTASFLHDDASETGDAGQPGGPRQPARSPPNILGRFEIGRRLGGGGFGEVFLAYGYGSEVSLLGRFGWYIENSGKQMHPPKALLPNMRGLFDLHGNAFEWTHDWYDDSGVDAVTDPVGPSGGSSRVYRGGGWVNDAANCRAANRNTRDPTSRTNDFGFRLALSPSGVSSPAEQGQGKGAKPAGGGTEERSEAATTVP